MVGDTGRDVSRASVGELIGEVTRDMSTLMRQELALAKAEVTEEAVKAARAGGMLGGAGFAGYMVLLFASIAAWWGLAEVMPSGWAALIVAAIWAVIGAVLFAVGRQRMREVNPKPERTVETVKRSSGNPQGSGEEITMSTDPDQIRSEIDQTQRELSADVDALTEKLSPQRIVERRVRRTRTAMTNMKDKMMGSTTDASPRRQARRPRAWGRPSAPRLPPRGIRWPTRPRRPPTRPARPRRRCAVAPWGTRSRPA